MKRQIMTAASVFAIAATVTACSSTSAAVLTPSAPAPTPQIVYVPAPTPQIVYVTPAPPVTPDPTPIPVADPVTPVISPVILPADSGWGPYIHWSARFSGQEAKIGHKLVKALDHGNVGAAIRLTRQDLTLQQRNIDWLTAHPATSCYVKVWNLDLAASKAYSTADETGISWLRDFPYGSNRDFKAHMRDSRHGTSLVKAGTKALKHVTCD